MENIYIIGSGMIRFNKYPDKTVKTMAEEAINLALADAGLGGKDIQAALLFQHLLGDV